MMVKLDIENGGALCSECSSQTGRDEFYPMKSLFILDFASGASLDEFLNQEYDEIDLNAASTIISRFTNHYLAKAIKSRSIMDSTLND